MLFSAREKVSNSFKRIFPIRNLDEIPTRKPTAEPKVATESTKSTKAAKAETKRKISSLKLREEFLNKIRSEEKNTNEQTFLEYFFYQAPAYLAKSLHDNDKIKNDEIIKHINNGLIKLRNSINSNETPENKNPKKVVLIIEKIADLNKQQKGKGRLSDLPTHIKVLAPKQMLQRLPKGLVKECTSKSNSTENLLNEIRQVIYSLYRAKEITKQINIII